MAKISGTVVPGRNVGSTHISDAAAEIELLTGERLERGTLNVLLDKPLKLRRDKALPFEGGHRLLWPAVLNGSRVWLYRWSHAPLHVAEFLAAQSLRKTLGLKDQGLVTIEIADDLTEPAPSIAWALLWKGRKSWVYTHDRYNRITGLLSHITGFALEESSSVVPKTIGRVLRKLGFRRARPRYTYSRASTHAVSSNDRELRQVLNLLNYAKTSGSSYSASQFPAGYHSIELHGRHIAGQRNPAARLEQSGLDFTGKSVLDFGSNQGGMLLQLADTLKWGVGVDFDSRLVNAANRIKAIRGSNNVSFYVFNLEKEDLQLLHDLMPEGRADICFLLSVCMWLANWKQVIDAAASLADAVLFETNGSAEQQKEQIQYLKLTFKSVSLVADESADDPGQKQRKLLIAKDRRGL